MPIPIQVENQFVYRNFEITVWALAVEFLSCDTRGVWRGPLARVLLNSEPTKIDIHGVVDHRVQGYEISMN